MNLPAAPTFNYGRDILGFISHRLMPTSLIGDHGLSVGMIGTDDDDIDGHVFMLMAEEMNFGAAIFASGIDQLKERFELGGLPDTPEIFDCPLIPVIASIFIARS